jgi:hypothetical protein
MKQENCLMILVRLSKAFLDKTERNTNHRKKQLSHCIPKDPLEIKQGIMGIPVIQHSGG